ncbi:DUF1343 domain-containing protein [Tamlana sp. 2_MG-2023]|uniref:exo-beta-N-acetylmuramidase NamZ family protein n=1 Tax=unclassified Tamlana TaxID=2614803 RepID=UPI0026E20E38|nr:MULTISPECIES: DUF1343 domain-containing protein [unclassified Tamlana]MDO6760181.1 DUF1343 domain-containing protein [Tamlana sp. 2_MG-2023]MDO6790121.1 DUF1343 domain-containing protein [Tamlana sp. 1_MG-2023]
MKFNIFKNTVLLFVLVNISCASKVKAENSQVSSQEAMLQRAQHDKIEQAEYDKNSTTVTDIIVGANQTENYLPLIEGKRIGIVANQTSVIFKNDTTYTHLVDSLVSLKVNIKSVFAPEHGFRGQADAGEVVKDGIDTKTNLPIVSLYGKNKKPSAEQLKDIDLIIFDIQDVGARFYTYISSLHYVMEACAEQNIPVVILDRPNPNGSYIDGPILEKENKSFVGMHPIPIVHGMSIGEYAKMINGEKWLENGLQCELTVISNKNYNRNLSYSLPIKPSPNLPNDQSINLYPSLCFFEGTNVNAGRGTEKQFQVFGSPFLNKEKFKFQYTPIANAGSKYPKHQNKLCYGEDLTEAKTIDYINLSWLIEAYQNTSSKKDFFNNFFIKLAGTSKLQEQIESGLSAEAIKARWKSDLDAFEKMRTQYLLYP